MTDFRFISSMDREDRIGGFKEDQLDEQLLDRFNGSLGDVEELLRQRISQQLRSTILITGVPRSGTTYLHQLMAAQLDVGYVSNLMARFYSVPLTGAWLQSLVLSNEIRELSGFASTHGVTARVYEPHEFGYFWSRHFPFVTDNHEDVDVDVFKQRLVELEQTLQSIAGIFAKPVVYKCAIAPFILRDILESTSVFIVHARRRKEDVVNSILSVRRQRLGTDRKWWSIRPKGWEGTLEGVPREQVSWQYDRVVESIDLVASESPGRCVEVCYEDLVNAPEDVVQGLMDKYLAFASAGRT